jgi:aspartate carbamoyltransferase regulatory subunit
MIFGVSIIGKELDSKKSVQLFKHIKNYLCSRKSCITTDEPPPVNSNEFIVFCNKRYVPIEEI